MYNSKGMASFLDKNQVIKIQWIPNILASVQDVLYTLNTQEFSFLFIVWD